MMRPLFPYLALFAFSLITLWLSGPYAEASLESLHQQVAHFQTVTANLSKTETLLHRDALAIDLAEVTEAERARLLAPLDRTALSHLLQQKAMAEDLTDFSYSLSPEEKAARPDLSRTLIALQGEAPDDRALNRFLDHLANAVTGRLVLVSIEMTRKDAPLATANLRFNIKLELTALPAKEDAL